MAPPKGPHKNSKSRKKFLKRVGARLTQVREGQNMAQRALAKAAGVSSAAVSRFESGDHSPTLGTLHDLATTLGVHPASFLIENLEKDPVQELRLILDGQPSEMLTVVEKCAVAIVARHKTKK